MKGAKMSVPCKQCISKAMCVSKISSAPMSLYSNIFKECSLIRRYLKITSSSLFDIMCDYDVDWNEKAKKFRRELSIPVSILHAPDEVLSTNNLNT